ncbi:MAG: creatininase family protein [Bacteroidales bacterium]
MIRNPTMRRLAAICVTLAAAVAAVLIAARPALAQALAVPRAATAQAAPGTPGDLSVRWEELTAPDFARAVERSGATAIIALGIIEKHGPHLPLGTDLLDARELALRAVKREYSIVFPPYYAGQIFEAKHQPGTIAYSQRLMWDMLQETVDEIARNGIKKIILVNGHGGNDAFLEYFCQSQLARPHDYAVYLYQPSRDPQSDARVKALRQTTMDMHAGEMETSRMAAHRPDLAHPERAHDQSGGDQARLEGLENAYTAIWWYARFPNHYAGDGSPATAQLGNLALDADAEQLAAMIRAVKADTTVLELQKRFFDESDKPLATPQKK